jgi:hypothetical protein
MYAYIHVRTHTCMLTYKLVLAKCVQQRDRRYACKSRSRQLYSSDRSRKKDQNQASISAPNANRCDGPQAGLEDWFSQELVVPLSSCTEAYYARKKSLGHRLTDAIYFMETALVACLRHHCLTAAAATHTKHNQRMAAARSTSGGAPAGLRCTQAAERGAASHRESEIAQKAVDRKAIWPRAAAPGIQATS